MDSLRLGIDQLPKPVLAGIGPPAAFQCVGQRVDAILLLQCDEQRPRAFGGCLNKSV
jgi:hypothetical protein